MAGKTSEEIFQNRTSVQSGSGQERHYAQRRLVDPGLGTQNGTRIKISNPIRTN